MHPLPITLALNPSTDWLSLPARPGVVMLLGDHHAVIQIAATGDTRAFCAQRLDPSATLGPKADLRPITRTIRATPVGSPLEGDLLTLELAHRHLPSLADEISQRGRLVVLAVNPSSPAPAWKRIALGEAVGGDPHRELLGPFSDSATASRFSDLLDSIFELCRYPRELALAPLGSPCAYKDMGCPAACDGSEPMPAYVGRLRDALEFASGSQTASGLGDALAESMQSAAKAEDFESAAKLQRTMDLVRKAQRAPYRAIGAINQLAVLAVLPSEKFGSARLLLLAGGRVTTLADVFTDSAAEAWTELGPEIEKAVHDGIGYTLDHHAAATLGVWCRHWFKPARRAKGRRATFFQIRYQLPSRSAVVRAVRHAAAATEHDEFADSSPDSGPGSSSRPSP